MSSSLIVKETKFGSGLPINSFGTMVSNGNNVYENAQTVYILSGGLSRNVGKIYINEENFIKSMSIYSSRKLIKGNWINDKDEYLVPNENHEQYEQFTYDSVVYSLFNNSSQQSSLRNVTYKEQQWDIKNEFFWMSKETMKELGETNNYDELYRDSRNGSDRFVYNKLFVEGLYDKLSPDAKRVLDMASELVVKSIPMRQAMSDTNPEYHLNSWDCGYSQLKLVWKEYFKEDFTKFRDEYKKLEDRMRPLVYELGFLK
jgi:hypothetical protein